jgi:rubrerythrin
MPAQTTRDILDQARFFHRQMRAFYDGLRDRIDQPKLALVLDYLCRHEDRMAEALRAYEQRAADRVLNAWFQFAPGVSVESALAAVPAGSPLTLDDLLRISVLLENELIQLYRRAAEGAADENVKTVFERLADEAVKDRTRLSRDLTDMVDL